MKKDVRSVGGWEVLLFAGTCCLFWACGGGGGGAKDAQCNDKAPNFCEDGSCHECCADTDCTRGKECRDFKCVKPLPCAKEGESCTKGPCCSDLCCDSFTKTCVAKCLDKAGCTAQHATVDFFQDLSCNGGSGCCEFSGCASDAQCAPGQVCFSQKCVTIPSCDEIASCEIAPKAAVITSGKKVQLTVAAYLKSGAQAPGLTFAWSTDSSDVAAMENGAVTGGKTTSKTLVGAQISGCAISCKATITNYGPVTQGSRVVVVDELAQTPLPGATVVLGDKTAQTDDLGVALFDTQPSAASKQDVSVFRRDYHYLTFRGVESNDVIAPISKLYEWDFTKNPEAPTAVAGGIKGSLYNDLLTCPEGGTCDVLIGLTGFSIPGNLTSINPMMLIGGLVKTPMAIAGLNSDFPLPAGLVGGLVNQKVQWLKERYAPTGVPGKRVLWGLGGYLSLIDMLDILKPAIESQGKNLDLPKMLSQIAPMVSRFSTAVVPNVEVASIPQVADVNDQNMNKSTTDLIPDYDSFPELGIHPKDGMDKEIEVVVPPLPKKQDGTFALDAVVVIAGANVKDQGFVPLGIGLGLDRSESQPTPDGMIDPIKVMVSDVNGRLPETQVQRALVVISANIDQLIGGLLNGTSVTIAVSGQIVQLPAFAGTQTLNPFMVPAQGSFDAATRKLNLSYLPEEIDYAQLLMASEVNNANWNILGQFEKGELTIPTPALKGDRADAANVITFRLNGRTDYQGLLRFDDLNLNDLVTLIESFTYTHID